jgi:GTPase SAR1 family protein
MGNSEESFRSIDSWVQDAKEFGRTNMPLVIVGNKSDLAGMRVISVDQANSKAKEEEACYIETSAKNGDNVEKAFEMLACTILENIKLGKELTLKINRQN